MICASHLRSFKSDIILFASCAIAIILAINHPSIAAMLTYISGFLSGMVDPLWPHVCLLSFSVAASVAVGAGIIFERPKYSESIHRVAFWLVVVGIVVEAVCTIFLFVFDEGISSAQQSKIIALETQIAPRWLNPDQQKSLKALLAKYPGRTVHVSSYMQDTEGALFAEQILRIVSEAGLTKDDKRMRVESFSSVTSGLAITGTETPLVDATTALFKSFNLALVSNEPVQNNFMNVEDENALFPLKIFVGPKPLPIDSE